MTQRIPLVFACSGCSNAGHLTDRLARELDRRGIAEMSCLAGMGAAKPPFLKRLSEREVWVIDGCPIECSLGVFDQIRQHIDAHIRLHDLGVRKNASLPADDDFHNLIDAVLQHVDQQKQSVLHSRGIDHSSPHDLATQPPP